VTKETVQEISRGVRVAITVILVPLLAWALFTVQKLDVQVAVITARLAAVEQTLDVVSIDVKTLLRTSESATALKQRP